MGVQRDRLGDGVDAGVDGVRAVGASGVGGATGGVGRQGWFRVAWDGARRWLARDLIAQANADADEAAATLCRERKDHQRQRTVFEVCAREEKSGRDALVKAVEEINGLRGDVRAAEHRANACDGRLAEAYARISEITTQSDEVRRQLAEAKNRLDDAREQRDAATAAAEWWRLQVKSAADYLFGVARRISNAVVEDGAGKSAVEQYLEQPAPNATKGGAE